MVSEEQINQACIERFDGVERCLLVQEILEAEEKIKQLQADNKIFREVIEGALRISDLWTLKEVESMFEDEAKALYLMKERFEQALKEKGGE